MNKYDVFISHASADKLNYVEELKNSFAKLGISIFYDNDSIEWGDNWKNKIFKGLDNCDYAVIVISKNFFGREWTEMELKNLLTRQNANNTKIVLPILYDITIADVKRKYKTLADIQFIDSQEKDIKDITINLAKILLNDKKTHKKEHDDENDKYEIIKNYVEIKMNSSLEFSEWLSELFENNNEFVEPYSDYWIDWNTCEYKGEKIPLFQSKKFYYGYGYRINPKYYESFKQYFEKELKPQM